MFGHHWQPAEGTLVDIRTTHFGSGGTAHVTRYFLMDVQPSSGEPFRTEVKEPLWSSSFIAPAFPGEKVKLKCDPARKEAHFDDSDHKTSRKAARQADAGRYQAELHAEAGTGITGTGDRDDEKGAKLERLTELHERGALTDAEFEAQMHSILRSS